MPKLDSNGNVLKQCLTVMRERHSVHMPEFLRFDPAKKWGPHYALAGIGDKYQPDSRNVSLYNKPLDLSEVILRQPSVSTETSNIYGFQRYSQLKMIERRFMRLGVAVFLQVLEHEDRVPVAWKHPLNGRPITIYFDGDYFLDPDSRLIVPCITFEDGVMIDSYHWVDDLYGPLDFSALLLIKEPQVGVPEVISC